MKYPRVLLLYMTKVHSDDPQNLLIRTVLGDWPKENIAQIFTGCYSGTGEFCVQCYAIGRGERRFDRIFGLLKRAGVSAMSGKSLSHQGMRSRSSLGHVLSKRIVSSIIDSGFWEVIFRVRLSTALASFVRDFNPDIICTEGYSIGLTRLALQIMEKFSVPLCYFPLDDWHSYLYHASPVHIEVDHLARAIAKRASLRFALGPKMTEILTQRYNVNFECIYHADDLARFRVLEHEESSDEVIVIGFSGSLVFGRITCLSDLLRACQLLNQKFRIRVFCTSVPVETPEGLLNSESVEFLPLPVHDKLPQALAGCDILFLPESFDTAYRRAIELSLSSKCHLYMMSGRPILVYGPPWSGTVDYAKRFGWGVVVDRQDDQELLHAIRCATSQPGATEMVAKGYSVARANHDVKVLRRRMLERVVAVTKDRMP
jgi:hypothetical protein